MEREHNRKIDELIEKTILFTIEQDVTSLHNRTDDYRSNTKRLLLLHLFIQQYNIQTAEPTKQSDHPSNDFSEIVDKIDILQRQADEFIREIDDVSIR